MIRTRIQHIFQNYNKKLTIYDYMQEPVISIKKDDICDAKYVARAVFNSINAGKGKKANNSLGRYRKYKMKHGKSRMKNLEMLQKSVKKCYPSL